MRAAWIESRSSWLSVANLGVFVSSTAVAWGVHAWIRTGPFVQRWDEVQIHRSITFLLAAAITARASLRMDRGSALLRATSTGGVLVCNFLACCLAAAPYVVTFGVASAPLRSDTLVDSLRQGAGAVAWCASLGAILSMARTSAPLRVGLFVACAWWVPALLDLPHPILGSIPGFPGDTLGDGRTDMSMMLPHLLALGTTFLERARR